MSNLNLKGIWIPIEILTDDNLSDKEKIIYAIIIYLSKENQYCFLTNKTISELFNISVTQVSKLVNSLKDKNYINIKLIYKENSKQVEMRKLIPIGKNKDTYLAKVKSLSNKNSIPLLKKSLRIINIYNKYGNGEKKNKRMQPNFEERDYTGFDFSILYANANMLKTT